LLIANSKTLEHQKPARIPSQTYPPRGQMQKNKLVSVLRKLFSGDLDFRKTESVLKPRHTARVIEGRTSKEKHPFIFQKKFHPRQNRNARDVFSFGVVAESAKRWRGDYPRVRSRTKPPRAPRVRYTFFGNKFERML